MIAHNPHSADKQWNRIAAQACGRLLQRARAARGVGTRTLLTAPQSARVRMRSYATDVGEHFIDIAMP